MSQSKSSFVFQLELGMLIRDSVIFDVKSSSIQAGLICEVTEDRGFFSSDYRIKISGPHEKCKLFREKLKTYLYKMSD